MWLMYLEIVKDSAVGSTSSVQPPNILCREDMTATRDLMLCSSVCQSYCSQVIHEADVVLGWIPSLHRPSLLPKVCINYYLT